MSSFINTAFFSGRRGRRANFVEAPKSKLQHPEKLQVPIFKRSAPAFWSLTIGISLQLGCWILEL